MVFGWRTDTMLGEGLQQSWFAQRMLAMILSSYVTPLYHPDLSFQQASIHYYPLYTCAIAARVEHHAMNHLMTHSLLMNASGR